MKQRILSAIFIASFILCSCAHRETWHYDENEARELAQKEHKDILLLACDGEDESVAFREGVCETEKFIITYGEDFVLLALDLSAAPGEDELTRYEKLLRRLGNNKLPAVYFFSHEMYPLGGVGYCGLMPAEDFDQAAESVLGAIQETKTLLNAVRSSNGTEKARAIDALVRATDEHQRLLLNDLIKEFCTLDSNNETGLLGEYIVRSAYYDALEAFENGGDPALPFTEAAGNTSLSNEERQELLYMAAYALVCLPERDLERVHSLLEEAYSIDADSSYAESIFSALDGIRRFSAIQSAEGEDDADAEGGAGTETSVTAVTVESDAGSSPLADGQ